MSISNNINAKQTIEEAYETILQSNSLLLEKSALMALDFVSVEGVRQTRVALRKTRSALSAFKSIVPKKAERKSMQK